MKVFKLKNYMVAAVAALAIGGTTAASAATLKTVTFGTPNLNLPYLPIFVADVMGYFEQNGIKPQFQTFKTGGSTAMAALIGGNIDIFPGSSSSALTAYEKGTGVVIAGALVTQYTSVVVARKSFMEKKGITANSPLKKKMEALKGATIGVTSPGSGTDHLAHFLLKQAGLDPTRDVSMVYVGGAQAVVAAFARGRVDAIITSSPSTDEMIRDHDGVLMFNTAAGEIQELDGYPYITINTTKSWIDNKHALAVATIKSIIEAEAALHDPKKQEQIREAVKKKYFPSLDAGIYRSAWKSVIDAYPKNPRISDKQIKLAISFSNEYSEQKFPASASKAFTNELIDEAEK